MSSKDFIKKISPSLSFENIDISLFYALYSYFLSAKQYTSREVIKFLRQENPNISFVIKDSKDSMASKFQKNFWIFEIYFLGSVSVKNQTIQHVIYNNDMKQEFNEIITNRNFYCHGRIITTIEEFILLYFEILITQLYCYAIHEDFFYYKKRRNHIFNYLYSAEFNQILYRNFGIFIEIPKIKFNELAETKFINITEFFLELINASEVFLTTESTNEEQVSELADELFTYIKNNITCNCFYLYTYTLTFVEYFLYKVQEYILEIGENNFPKNKYQVLENIYDRLKTFSIEIQ